MKLEGKAAIVTGASSGIGQGIAVALGGEGASVAVNYSQNREGAENTAAKLTSLGAKALVVRADISSEEDVNMMVEKTVNEFGGVHILVNNAAFLKFDRAYFHETNMEDWDRHIDVSLKGVLFCCRAVIPHMIRQEWGRIINITSEAAKNIVPYEAVYAACKAGLAGFTRSIAGELARYNIMVNCVSPGIIVTPALEARDFPKKSLDKMVSQVPLRRMGDPDDIGNMVLFLSSEDSKYITAQHWSVSGGVSVH
ncbi:SDR family NAD(P)-dependent oxidoreductase [Chloroflexota bacterium]